MTQNEGEIDYDVPPIYDVVEPSEFEDDSSSMSSETSVRSHGAISDCASPPPPEVRYERVVSYIEGLDWDEVSAKKDMLDICWAMELSYVSSILHTLWVNETVFSATDIQGDNERTFPSRISIRRFVRTWSHKLRGRSDQFDELYIQQEPHNGSESGKSFAFHLLYQR
jgi:hypothetical protein